MIDTCYGGDILAVCQSITGNPITLLTSHSDPDHIGCDHQFPTQFLHPAEFERYKRIGKQNFHARPMAEGDRFPVGNFTLEIIHVPGHTPGSVAFLDRNHKFLFGGDTVQNKAIYMYGDGRDMNSFRSSVKKLEQMRQADIFNTIYSSHGECALSADILSDHIALADDLLNGHAVEIGPAPSFFPNTVKTYCHGRAQMFYDKSGNPVF